MTPDQAQADKIVTEVLEEVSDEDGTLYYDRSKLQVIIADALRAARAEVWREAAESHTKDSEPCEYCLAKAAALDAQGKEGVGDGKVQS